MRWALAAALGLAGGVPLLIWDPVALAVAVAGGLACLRLWLTLRRVRATADAPLATLMNLIEVRDGVSPGHAYRVALVAAALAEAAGRDPREVARMRRAAVLHNIGSLAIAPGLLSTPTPLTPDQERDVARHTVIGAEALGGSVVSRELVPIVRHHHERWDGGGYPDGLAGEEIPLGARIVAVADTAVALRSPRPYRPALEIEDVIALLRDGASRQWDPRVVDHLVALIATAHPPVLTALEVSGPIGVPEDPALRVVTEPMPWTGPPKMGGAPSRSNVTSLPEPVAASPPAGEREVVAHE